MDKIKLEFDWLKNQYNLIAAAFGGLVLGAVKLYSEQDVALFWWTITLIIASIIGLVVTEWRVKKLLYRIEGAKNDA